MYFTRSTVLAAFLFATSIVAAPRGHSLAHRVSQRAAGTRQSGPAKHVESVESTNSTNTGINTDAKSDITYTGNWAGAALTAPSGDAFKMVTGSFVVPTPSAPAGAISGTTYSSTAWVGIDGYSYGRAILQTGIDFSVTDGVVSYDAWYEWFPDGSYDFSGLDICAGDIITVTVEASSLSAGTATIQSSNGQSVVQKLAAPNSSSNLAGVNAEWIVEDFDVNGSEVPFANFGTVVFSDAGASTFANKFLGTDGAGIIELSLNGTVLTDVSVENYSTVSVVYTGA